MYLRRQPEQLPGGRILRSAVRNGCPATTERKVGHDSETETARLQPTGRPACWPAGITPLAALPGIILVLLNFSNTHRTSRRLPGVQQDTSLPGYHNDQTGTCS